MRYVPPYGTTDPNGAYINGDRSLGRQGSIPPAAAFENPMRELDQFIAKSGQVPSDTDLLQLTKGVRSQRLNYAIDTGTQNNLTVAYDPPITEYGQGGLTLRVRVRFTNNLTLGPSSIDAGAGRRPIVRMNSQPVGDRELTQGGILTLVFDGTQFQLSNFGVSTGDTNITQVNVPYADDTSDTPGRIEVSYPLMPLPLIAGNIIAVRVANTASGATQLFIDDTTLTTPYNLLPNGGGVMLQGDIVADDVVQFFYDGANLRFVPNPEISAPVTYSVGPGQQFTTIDAAFDALKRKIIGQSGSVTLQWPAGATQGQPLIIPGPINVAHPSGDRITVKGTMFVARPQADNFEKRGSDPITRAADAISNYTMLRNRFGTEIRIPNNGGTVGDVGVMNTGAGRITFQDLLITGTQIPLGADNFTWQVGVYVPQGTAARCDNVTVWGAQGGFNVAGGLTATDCYASANANYGWAVGGVLVATGLGSGPPGAPYGGGGSFGNGIYGLYTVGAAVAFYDQTVQANGFRGITAGGGASVETSWGRTQGNATWDIEAAAATVALGHLPPERPDGPDVGPTKPPVGVPGGPADSTGAVITRFVKTRPPPPAARSATASGVGSFGFVVAMPIGGPGR